MKLTRIFIHVVYALRKYSSRLAFPHLFVYRHSKDSQSSETILFVPVVVIFYCKINVKFRIMVTKYMYVSDFSSSIIHC